MPYRARHNPRWPGTAGEADWSQDREAKVRSLVHIARIKSSLIGAYGKICGHCACFVFLQVWIW